MAGLSADRLEQQGATGDGFAMMSRISQTDEQIPPVEHQRDTAGHQAAALEVARREATPTPLVLQFVKTVLAIGAIAIELTERQYLAIERRDENGIFKDLARLVDLGKAEPQLTVTVTFAQRRARCVVAGSRCGDTGSSPQGASGHPCPASAHRHSANPARPSPARPRA